MPKNSFGEQSSVYKGNVLRIANVTKDNRGTYYCVATNVVGQGARRNVDVEGMAKSKIKEKMTCIKRRLVKAVSFMMFQFQLSLLRF